MRRTERLGAAGGRQHKADKHRIIRRDQGICYICHEPGADEIDHVIPFFEGGTDHDSNKRAIHGKPCHAAKSVAERLRATRRAGDGRGTYPV